MTNPARKFVVLASAVAALAAFAAPAAAQTMSVAVSYADLNLANPAGVATFNRRVKVAVASICGNNTDGLSARAATVRCRNEATRGVQGEISRVVADAGRADQRVVLAAR